MRAASKTASRFALRLALAGAALSIACTVLGAQQDRLRGPVETNRAVRLPGSLLQKVSRAADRGAVERETPIHGLRLMIAQTDAQRADLERLLEAQMDPASPDYRNWLTPEQFGERFGLSENDLANISAWLESRGFVTDRVARARNWIAFSGTAGQIADTFGTELHRIELDGKMHVANLAEASIPASLAGIVDSVRGLDDFRPTPLHVKAMRDKENPEYNKGSGGHNLAPDDLAQIYDIEALYAAGFDGTGQKLVIPGQTDVNLADMRAFRAQFGLAANDPQMVLYGSDPGTSSDDEVEADLDLEWSGAVARKATIIYVYSQNVFESIEYAIDQNLAPVISLSYGGCEAGSPTSMRSLAQQANAQGITWMNAAGDSGAAGCDADATVATHGPSVIFPADIPEVTAVGGTEFSEGAGSYWSSQNGPTLQSALSYIPEVVWNDTASTGGIEAGGGGASTLFSKPWWQSGAGVPSDGARDVPDVSLTASAQHDGYEIFSGGSMMPVGGTSASSPSFAGIVAILNQYLTANSTISKPGLGNINPTLYNLAQKTAGLFHDTTAGNNDVPCAAGSTGCASTHTFGYSAGAGYDQASGLGSVDAYNLVTKWTSVPAVTGAAMTLSASPSTISTGGTAQLTATVTTVSGSATPSGSVTFTAGGSTLGSAALSGSGASATAKLTVKASSLSLGSDSITASYSPAGSSAGASATATVTVTAPQTATLLLITANPTSITPTGSTVLTAVVTASTGTAIPAGSVTFALGSQTLGSATLTQGTTNATATFTVNGTSLASGSNTINATYAAGAGFSASSASLSISVAPAAIATTVSLTAAPSSIQASASTVITATVKAGSGTNTPTGSVKLSAGNQALGSTPLSNGVAKISVAGSSLQTGANTIVAVYTPGTGFTGSTSSPVTVTVAAPTIATTTALSASSATIAQNATTSLTATVTASGSSTPAGTVSFSSGGATLGTAALTSGSASLTIKGSSLAIGKNSITATYSPGQSSGYTGSSASVTVSVTAPPVATTMAVSASATNINSSASTVVTASVKAATGTTTPSGTVTFSLGSVQLGSASLSGSGGTATASLTVNGSTLKTGNDTITASYGGSTAFTGSTGSVTVAVAQALVTTTTTLTAGAASLAATASTQVTVVVKAAGASTAPSGKVTLAIGRNSPVTATLSALPGTAGTATATFTLKGSSLAAGVNTITATYSGSTGFSGSSASMNIAGALANVKLQYLRRAY